MEKFGPRDPSPSPLSGLRKDTIKENTEQEDSSRGQGAKREDSFAAGRGTDHEENGVDKSLNSLPKNVTHYIRKEVSQEAGGTFEITPADDFVKPVDTSVLKVVISDKNKQVESLTDSDSFQQKSDESEEKCRLEEAKERSETSKGVKSVKESEVAECSEEKSFLPSGPPVVRTSWLSCCCLFDVMAGSER